MSKETSKQDGFALACALTAVAIWAWWMPATRIAAQQGIAPLDVALLRYSIPALLLLPVWLPTLRKLKHAPVWAITAMLGWGAPFLWLVTASLRETGVVYLATIVPCTMPVLAVVAERVFFSQKLSSAQFVGFALTGLAALLVIFSALMGGGVDLSSLGLMFLAAGGWACYVVAFRHTGLTAAEGAAWVCVASTLVILVIKLSLGTAFLPLTTEQIVFNAISQGLISGFVAVLLYTIAIGRLGPARAASFGVLVPTLGSFFAWIWLGETPTSINLLALFVGTLGVAVINGVIKVPRPI